MHATYLKHLTGFNGDARLYAVEPPVSYDDSHTAGHVVVSKVCNSLAHETYIFPANEEGVIIYWGELTGSRQGEHSHEEVLRYAGYEVCGETA